MNEESFLDRIPCGILTLKTDQCFTVLSCNSTIKTWFQTPALLEDMVLEADYPGLSEGIRRYLSGQADKAEYEFRARKPKPYMWYSIQIKLIPEEELLYCSLSDITYPKKLQEQLRVREEQYRLASQHSGCLVSIYDIHSKTLIPSPEFSKTFPFPYTQPLSSESLAQNGMVHKESVLDAWELYKKMDQGIPNGRSILRLKTICGDYRWFSARYSLVYTEDQRPLRGIISYQDITDQYEKELAYQRWMEYMEEQKKDCIGYYEYNLKFDLFEEIIGETTHNIPESISNSFSDMVNYIAEHHIFEEDREIYLKFFNKNQLLYDYYRGCRSLRLEHRRLRADGTVYWSLGLIQLVSDPYTDTIKAFIFIKDIDKSKQEALSLQEMSERDSLTGLLNRAAAIRTIRSILKDSQGHHILIMLDIDRFKQLNDKYGHMFGDKALHRAASRLKSALRRDDVLGRMGGDEFIILLKDVSYCMDLYSRLEKFCGLISSSLEPEAFISGSLGTAAYPENGTAFEELYEKADIALYHAKSQGRNQYAVYEAGMSMPNQ
ncbi:MAG: sensor domain-containing diguanylate cyclase [Lacrimispora sp.]|uniref:diguanylate cyclase domain-containing protein n=1 Tax=Lacrimispora sp. TaxID=2719234 RepID=UPI0039E23F0B